MLDFTAAGMSSAFVAFHTIFLVLKLSSGFLVYSGFVVLHFAVLTA